MEKGNKRMNPFMQGDGNSKSGNPLNLFKDDASSSHKEEENLNLPFKLPGGKTTFEYSVGQKPSEYNLFNPSKINEKAESNPPSGTLGNTNIFSSDISMKSESSTSFAEKFGRNVTKTSAASSVPVTSPSEAAIDASKVSPKQKYFRALFGGVEGKSHNFQIFKPSAITTSSESHWTPKALFSMQSKDKLPENIFGGKTVSESPRSFKSLADISKSSVSPKFQATTKSFSFGKSQSMPGTNEQSDKTLFSSNKFTNESSSDSRKSLSAQKDDPGVDSDILKPISAPSKEKPPHKESSMLIAVDIPANYLDKSVLTNHFSKFGKVKKVILNNKTKQASVYFTDHKSASEAKAKGRKLHPLIPEMKLFFGTQTSMRKPTESTKKVSRSSFPSTPIGTSEVLVKTEPPLIKRVVDERSKGAAKQPQQAKAEIRNKAPSGNLGSLKDLNVLMKSQSKNNYDKFLILDARDKNIRSKLKKEVDVKKARYLAASCPDMCPEKERYSRDIQYDISLYEMTNNEVDHRLTVKKFSRSSADKDEPLPHELRPGPVLKMTMDYLCCNVIEKGNDINLQVDLWYNYLCNRTRGLRNDIMQQHLLDLNAVYVLERCIRFHIHCSHQLCEVSAEFFDAKINAEHLSKSLQSLRELYHDLEEKGYTFENEAEFRSYEILLNITDGNVIFKYLKFKDSIRKSQEVQFAIKVLHAIHASNYIQFFNLLMKATYLQACIMHKYFSGIRIKALSVIVKAYSFQQLPSPKAMKMLGFTSEDEIIKYLKYFEVDVEEGKMMPKKSKFIAKPELLPQVEKSRTIVAKKTGSVGEIIHNGPLPDNPIQYYVPHDSFDGKGYLKEAAYDASDQSALEMDSETDGKLEPDETLEGESAELRSMRLILYRKVEEIRTFNIFSKYFRLWRKYVYCQKEEKLLAERASRFILKKYIRLWKERARESSQTKVRINTLLLRKYFRILKLNREQSKEVKFYKERSKSIEREILQRKFGRKWKMVVDYRKLEREILDARRHLLSRKYFDRWLSITRNSICEKKSGEFYVHKLMKSSFNQWKSWISYKKQRSRINQETFPATGSFLSPKEQNDLMNWSFLRENNMNLSAHDVLETIENIEVKRRKHFALQKISGIVSWMPFPLSQAFQTNIGSSDPNLSTNIFSKYFKILILTDKDTDSYLLQWVRTKFNILEFDDLSEPLQMHTKFNAPYDKATYRIFVTEENFSVGARALSKIKTSLLILVGNEDKMRALHRIADSCSGIPSLILCRSLNTELIGKDSWLMSKETIDNPYISEKLFNFIVKEWKTRNQHGNVRIGKLCDVVNKFIYDKVLSPSLEISNQRNFFENYAISPSEVVRYFNNSILHVLECAEDSHSLLTNLLPEEVVSVNMEATDLCTGKHISLIKSSLKKTLLPSFSLPSKFSLRCVRETSLKYCREATAGEDWGGSLCTEMKRIIDCVEESLEVSGIVDLQAVPWIDIVSTCILYKLSLLPNVNFAYNERELNSFDHNRSLIADVRQSRVDIPKKVEERELTAKRKSASFPTSEMKKVKKSESLLLTQIRAEKEIALQYERTLKALIEDDYVTNC